MGRLGCRRRHVRGERRGMTKTTLALLGGLIFGIAFVVAVGTLMGKGSGEVTNPALAGGIAGLGLGMLVLCGTGRR